MRHVRRQLTSLSRHRVHHAWPVLCLGPRAVARSAEADRARSAGEGPHARFVHLSAAATHAGQGRAQRKGPRAGGPSAEAVSVEELAEVDGKPDGWLVFRGPGDPMETACGKQHVVARTEIALAFPVDP